MRIGQLRHKLTIQSPVETTDNYGQVTLTWTDTATRTAAIEPLQGKEAVSGKAIAPEATHKITLRHYDLSPRQRLLFGERVFNIVSVLTTKERNLETIVLATEQLC